MNSGRSFDELKKNLDALSEDIPEIIAARTAAVAKKADLYNTAFWETMHTGMAQNALKEGSDGSGGYLVPDSYDGSLVQALAEKNVLRKLGHVIQTTHKLHIPITLGLDSATWVIEGQPYSFSDAEFGRVTLDAHKLATSILVSDEMLEDGGIDLEAYIQTIFAERIGDAEEKGFISGTGGGMPLGLIYQAPVGAVSENAGTINMEDMLDLTYSVSSAYRKNAVWLVSEDAYRTLRQVKSHNGQNIWLNNLEKDGPETLFGHPVYVCKHLDTVAPGSKPVLFGDFSYFWIGDRGKRVIKRLIERFADRGQVAFLTSERVDAKLVMPEAIKCLEVKAA